jgi:hypothetical protein
LSPARGLQAVVAESAILITCGRLDIVSCPTPSPLSPARSCRPFSPLSRFPVMPSTSVTPAPFTLFLSPEAVAPSIVSTLPVDSRCTASLWRPGSSSRSVADPGHSVPSSHTACPALLSTLSLPLSFSRSLLLVLSTQPSIFLVSSPPRDRDAVPTLSPLVDLSRLLFSGSLVAESRRLVAGWPAKFLNAVAPRSERRSVGLSHPRAPPTGSAAASRGAFTDVSAGPRFPLPDLPLGYSPLFASAFAAPWIVFVVSSPGSRTTPPPVS